MEESQLSIVIPESHRELLERPLFAHFATAAPDGAPQSSVMWFDWDGEFLRFSHTKKRQKFKNLQHDPRVAASIADPDDPYRYIELRGVVEDIRDDVDGRFYLGLQKKYNFPSSNTDFPIRVVVSIRPTAVNVVAGGRQLGK
jgi:PPOX class probable F420-dependent enzyme